MVLTDAKAKRKYTAFKTPEAREEIDLLTEEDRNGRTDAEIVRDTARKFLDLFQEEGSVFNTDLEEAYLTMDNATEADPADLERAKATIAEYRQLKRMAEV